MARFRGKRHHSKAKMTIPLAIVAGFVPLASNAWTRFQREGIAGLGRELPADLIGIDPTSGVWNMKWLMRGTVPILGGFVIHKLAGKLGINRALGKAGIPFIRI
jgi:hypothetical protein